MFSSLSCPCLASLCASSFFFFFFKI
uniref:Uncharacterized protein n=1 Tax=Rhizophora mucronata TaxID=61149 RepID=A0A2P2NY71_RHIMU